METPFNVEVPCVELKPPEGPAPLVLLWRQRMMSDSEQLTSSLNRDRLAVLMHRSSIDCAIDDSGAKSSAEVPELSNRLLSRTELCEVIVEAVGLADAAAAAAENSSSGDGSKAPDAAADADAPMKTIKWEHIAEAAKRVCSRNALLVDELAAEFAKCLRPAAAGTSASGAVDALPFIGDSFKKQLKSLVPMLASLSSGGTGLARNPAGLPKKAEPRFVNVVGPSGGQPQADGFAAAVAADAGAAMLRLDLQDRLSKLVSVSGGSAADPFVVTARFEVPHGMKVSDFEDVSSHQVKVNPSDKVQVALDLFKVRQPVARPLHASHGTSLDVPCLFVVRRMLFWGRGWCAAVRT